MRVPKKRGTRSEANEVQIEESAPRDGRNPLDRPRSNIRANSFGRGPQRDTPAAWIVRCPAAVSSSPSPHVEMESKRESGELWKWRASLARNSLSRDGQRKGKRFGFLPREKSEGGGGGEYWCNGRGQGAKAKVGVQKFRAYYCVSFREIKMLYRWLLVINNSIDTLFFEHRSSCFFYRVYRKILRDEILWGY